MRGIKRSPYRQPVTPEGLRKIENGTLDYFDHEIYTNFNTGVLEQYLEEKNKVESFERSRFNWKKILILILFVGLPFTIVTQYVALNTGVMLGGAFYIAYILGIYLKWSPTEINIGSGAATAAEKTISGFVFTFPAIYFISQYSDLISGNRFDSVNLIIVLIIGSILASFMGLMYFIIFRRIWIVEDPLPSPGFQAFIKLLDIANDISLRKVEKIKGTMKKLLMSIFTMVLLGSLFYIPLFKVPNITERTSFIGYIFSNFHIEDWLDGGIFQLPPQYAKFTWPKFQISGMLFGIGWFLRIKASSMILYGSFFSWFIIVPLCVLIGLPIPISTVDPNTGETIYHGFASSSILENRWLIEIGMGPISGNVFALYGLPLAVGVIVGAGIVALVKISPIIKQSSGVFKDVKEDVISTNKGEREGYEWSTRYIIPTTIVTVVVFILLFWLLGGFDLLPSLLLGIIITPIIFLFSALTAKVTGELGIALTSTMTMLMVIILFIIMKIGLSLLGSTIANDDILLMVLLAGTIFTCTIAQSSDIMWDFKTGEYIGTRPLHLVKGQSLGIIIGVPVAGILAIFFSGIIIENGIIPPQAFALSQVSSWLIGGSFNWNIVLLGIFIGIIVELLTGLGTAFGIGMIIPFYIPIGIFTGAIGREIWEKRWLEVKRKRYNWSERTSTFKLLDTYIVMVGLIIGEAFFMSLLAMIMILS